MYTTPEPSPASTSGGDVNTRNARYAYLVGRLRSRQITMEEATELFNLMQATLARTDAARLAALAQASASRAATTPSLRMPPPLRPRRWVGAPTTSSSSGCWRWVRESVFSPR